MAVFPSAETGLGDPGQLMKFAILDIGSNSVRLMLWANGKSLYKKVFTTRLAEGADRLLSEAAMKRTVEAIALCRTVAEQEGAALYAFATAAVRSASNGAAFCLRVKKTCGVEIDVVSGEEEALLGMLGALGTAEEGGIVDIGGASTEILFKKGKPEFSVSLPLGCVTLFDRCKEKKDALRKEIGRVLCALDGAPARFPTYAIGGTASTLACVKLGLAAYDGAALQDTPLPATWVKDCAERLFALSVDERRKIAGMDPRRADIIAGGTLLLYEIMRRLGLDEVRFSDRDNLEGYLLKRGLA